MSLKLSVIIPAYNEETVIGGTLEAVTAYLIGAGMTDEMRVVDDGSTDRTAPIVQAFADRLPAVILIRVEHRGKGAAIKRGMLSARGAFRLFMDADRSTRIEEWRKLATDAGFEVVESFTYNPQRVCLFNDFSAPFSVLSLFLKKFHVGFFYFF